MSLRARLVWALFAVVLSALVLAPAGPVAADTIVIRAERVHRVSGPLLENGVIVVEGDRIRAVGARGDVEVPPKRIELVARVVTPGLIDAHTSAGLSGLYNVPADRDQDETSDPDQAALRGLDAFNPREPLLRYLLEHGVTLVQTGPGPVNPIAGQAGIFRTHGSSADEMVVRFPSALIFNLGESPKSTYGSKKGGAEFPSTRMATAALIRRRLEEGRNYAEAKGGGLFARGEGPSFDPGLDVLGQVAQGELPAIFRAQRADDILTAVRIAREFSLRALLAGGTEGYLVLAELASAGMPVLVGPVMERVSNPERANASYETAALLANSGIPIAIRSGFEGYVPKNRVVLFEAAIAAVNGLGAERALRAITLDAAKRLGVAESYGSIETGKLADLVLYDGDPFEYTTHIEAVIAAGKLVYTRNP